MRNKLNFCFLVILTIYGCANPVPPTGGPPDKTPPEIVEYSPANKTLNFKGDEVKIKFSKYMDKNSVIENVFISPTIKMEMDWSGKTFYIDFKEKPDTNTTYALTLGTDYTDLHQNKPTEAFTLVFSTGNHIDTGAIKGQLFDENPAGCFIFAYALNNINPDTLNPKHTKPNYRTQVGANGTFELKALKKGLFRIMAVRDQYKDEIYDEGIDAFAAANNDVVVRDTTIPQIKIKVGPTIDKIGPMMFDIEPMTNKKIVALFNKSLDTSSVTANSFRIEGDSGKKKAVVLHAFLDLKAPNKVDILTSEPLDTATKWQLIAVRDSAFAVRDSSGNIIQDTARKVSFNAVPDVDSTRLTLIKTPFPDSSTGFNPLKEINFIFNVPFEDELFKNRIKLTKLGSDDEMPFKIIWKEENYLSIIPSSPLQSDNWYVISFKMDSMKIYSDYFAKDTTIKLRFKTEDIRSYTSISGSVKDSLNCSTNYIVVLKSKDKNIKYSTDADKNNKWFLDNIPPGDYIVEVYCDANKNAKYDYGNAFPYEFSERFYIFPKELTVKPRWKIENLVLEMK